ncbi:MAG: hypothetical protein KGI54_04855 [Pseudomonadota bacterium]|nr:hypothetical protein [Pseudomonadota bacterium]
MVNAIRIKKSLDKDTHPSLSVVPYLCMVRPGIILNKDGSLMACFQFDGQDIDSIGENDLDSICDTVEHSLKLLNERFTLWWTVRRRKSASYPAADFGDNDIAKLIDDTHQKNFKQGSLYENTHYLTILFTQFSGMDGFFERLSMHMRKEKTSVIGAFASSIQESIFLRNRFQFEANQLDEAITQFENIITEFYATLSTAKFKRLELQDMLGFLNACVNPAVQKPRPVAIPRTSMLDAYLHDTTITIGREAMVFQSDKDYFVSALSIKDYPDMSRAGILDSLLAIDGEITVSIVYKILEQDKARHFIEKKRKHFLFTQKSLIQYVKDSLFKTNSAPDPGKASMAKEASIALGNITEVNAHYGYFNFTLLCGGDSIDEVENTIRLATAAINHLGFISVRERIGLQSAYQATIPGQWGGVFRWHLVSSANMADMAPIRTLDPGEKINRYLTEQLGSEQHATSIFHTLFNTPYSFNFHNGDIGHFLVIGPTGSGKSIFINFLIAQYQKYNPITIVFDKDRTCRIPILLQNGNYVDIDGGDIKLNPVRLIEDKKHWAFLARWIEMLLTYRGYSLSSGDDKQIQHAIEGVSRMNPDLWRLSSIRTQLSGALGNELDAWVGKGQFSHIFDNKEDGFSLGLFNGMEMGGLMLRFPKAAGAFMEYAFYRIDQVVGKGRPAFIYVEEAWFMLGDPVFARRLDDWLRTLRKKNAVIGMATQSLAEIENSDIFSSVIDSIPNKIYLPNREAFAHRVAYKEKFSLTDDQIKRIVSAEPKRHYYLVNSSLRRMLDVPMSKEILACLRSDVKAQNVFDQYYQNKDSNPNWKFDYLKEIARE